MIRKQGGLEATIVKSIDRQKLLKNDSDLYSAF